MNEEPNRREAELNEAALEGVSGGSAADAAAIRLCAACRTMDYASGTCGDKKHQIDLGSYIAANGPDSVIRPTQCPYYHR